MTSGQQRQLGGTEPDEVITPGKRTLSQCEAAAERGLASFGEALLEIKQRQLYKVAAGNWDDYCEQRWGINGRTANRQIQQARAMADLPPGSEVPSQREIARRAGESRTRASENRGRKSQDDVEGDEVPPTLGAPPDAPVSAPEAPPPPAEEDAPEDAPAPTEEAPKPTAPKPDAAVVSAVRVLLLPRTVAELKASIRPVDLRDLVDRLAAADGRTAILHAEWHELEKLRAAAASPAVTKPAAPRAIGRPRPIRESPKQSDCIHPPNQVRDGFCFGCGKEGVKPGGRRSAS